jgi:hypothetical protein
MHRGLFQGSEMMDFEMERLGVPSCKNYCNINNNNKQASKQTKNQKKKSRQLCLKNQIRFESQRFGSFSSLTPKN